MKFKHAASVAALCVAVAGWAGAADAQTYGRLVVFGDSLSDNGNLYLVTGGGTPTSPPYYQGRFSNGPTWVELLGFSLSHFNGSPAGSIDLAFGGAETGNAELPTPRGIRRQLTDYQLSGGVFGSGDLVTVWGGANNVFNNMLAAAGSGDPITYMNGVTTTAAGDIGFVVNGVAGAGAGTVLVANLPDLGATPQFRATPGQPLANYASISFNGALKAQLQAAAAANPDSNIIMMDVFRIGQAVQAQPGAFGFTNVTDRCFNGVTVCANPDAYMYWDSVHPTAAGHRLLASLAADYLEYGDRAAATAAEGETGLRHRARAFETVLQTLDGPNAPDAEGWSLYGGYDHDEASVDARGVISAADERADSVRVGLTGNGPNGVRMGAQLGYTRADVDAGALGFKTSSWSGDVFAGWRGGSWFVDGVAGLSFDDHRDIRRVTGVGLLVNDARTDGWSSGAQVRAGTRFDWSGISVSPRVSVAWLHGSVAGYAEDGYTARHLIADRSIDDVGAEASVRADAKLFGDFSGWVEAGYGDSLNYDADPVRVSLVDNTAQQLSREVSDPEGGQALLNLGVEGRVMEHVSVSVAYRGRFGDTDAHLGGVTLKMKF
jgi:outer membrane lipase/esterase